MLIAYLSMIFNKSKIFVEYFQLLEEQISHIWANNFLIGRIVQLNKYWLRGSEEVNHPPLLNLFKRYVHSKLIYIQKV